MPTVAPIDLDDHCIAAQFLGDIPVFAMASGEVVRLSGGTHRHALHDGLQVAACAWDRKSLVTGGEDGRVMRLSADGSEEKLKSPGRKWIHTIAAGPSGAVAWAEGRTATLRTPDGKTRGFEEARTIEGIAFAPKGLRLAFARYNGVSLHWGAGDAKPLDLEWKGAHTAVTFSPDGKFLVTAMQENALHGWKLDGKPGADGRHMRMTGYPAKVKSLSWSAKGRWLASSGAPMAIVWPFQGKDGPMGKSPLQLGQRADALVTAVACHPLEDLTAIAYADGMILAVRFADSREALLRRPGKGAVTTMDWSSDGRLLAYGAETGDCGVVDIAG